MISANIQLQRRSGFCVDVSLELQPGVTALYGPSGAGKSTILKLIAGLERGNAQDRIDITSDGVVWSSGSSRFVPPHKRGVGYVPQHSTLFQHLSVRGNLAYAEKRSGGAANSYARQIHEWLELTPLLDRPTRQLSGGEAQRVAIGRALLTGSRCLLMDEPLGAVDRSARNRILPCLDRLHHELDATTIYVSHSLEEVNYLADRVYVLEHGQVRIAGSVLETSSSLELAKDEGESLASVLECIVKGHDEQYELTELAIGGHRLYLAAPGKPVGTRCRVRIAARDVSITLDKPGNTSILNIIPATIDDIYSDRGPSVLVRLAVDEQFIIARITRKSLATLALATSKRVYAQIKGVAFLKDNG